MDINQLAVILLLVLPMAGFLLTALVGRRLYERAWIIAVPAIVLTWLVGMYLVYQTLFAHAFGDEGLHFTLAEWINVGSFEVPFNFAVDALTATLLIVVKFGAGLETRSVAMLSSLVDSLLDAAAALVNLLAVRHAMSPADREHRFGHGKAEPLAVLGQSAFITGSAMLLLAEAARRMISSAAVENRRIRAVNVCRATMASTPRPGPWEGFP